MIKTARKWFTLAEVLFSCMIIVITSMVLTPCFLKVHQNAITTRCIHNLTQLGVIWLKYAADNYGYAMPGAFYNGDSDRISFLTYIHNHYKIPEDILICPALTDETCFNPCDYDSKVQYMLTKGGYIMNTISDTSGAPEELKGYQGWPYSSKSPRIKLSQIKNLSEKIVMVCACACPKSINSKSGWNSDMSSLRSWQETDHGELPTTSGKNKRDVGNSHDGKFCALMGDGSVVVKDKSEWNEWAIRKMTE